MPDETCDVLVIGGGPAGLRAAELTAVAGRRTVLADRMPSVGRKFLVAGRGGLNLTHSEPVEDFPERYGDSDRWPSLLADFSPTDLQKWARDLGIDTFIGTSSRVFPATKQAAPLLRRWIKRLREKGVEFRMRQEWTGFRERPGGQWDFDFKTPAGIFTITAHTVVLALGGASWPQTGSNGLWTALLENAGVGIAPLAPANCGYEVAWPPGFLETAEGQPLKNLVVHAGGEQVAGELLITRYGLEGGALYQLGRVLRAQSPPRITVDLKPAFTVPQLVGKLVPIRDKPLADAAARCWKLSPAAVALLRIQPDFVSGEKLAETVKAFPIELQRPRPITEAISSAGGVAWSELDEDLMLRRCPGIFCVGEMIDWDAPTGGYLLQGCFSTATRAARGVNRFLK